MGLPGVTARLAPAAAAAAVACSELDDSAADERPETPADVEEDAEDEADGDAEVDDDDADADDDEDEDDEDEDDEPVALRPDCRDDSFFAEDAADDAEDADEAEVDDDDVDAEDDGAADDDESATPLLGDSMFVNLPRTQNRVSQLSNLCGKLSVGTAPPGPLVGLHPD